MPGYLSPAQLERDLSIPDLSDPADGQHAIQQLVQLAADELSRAWHCEVRWCRGPRIVTVADNYDGLGYDPAAVTREGRYTRYAGDKLVLRSHSTAMVPPALRALAARPARPRDVLLVCPGICYRRDSIDWQHTGTPHQLDLWRISSRPLGEAELSQMIGTLLGALVPGRASRAEQRVHPYTTDGRQLDVAHADGWVEVGECGLAHPAVLQRAGLAGCHGLALGMGLDRLLMLRKGIPDIRLLRSADQRISSQMTGLAPYQPVSTMPAVRRDLSVAVEPGQDDETIGDRVRDSLGADADCVEQVTILSSTPCAELPEAAVRRLGARRGQRNLLVRVVLRHLARTLTDAEANELRDRIYTALHQGGRAQWASAASPWPAASPQPAASAQPAAAAGD
ncbi:MAG TPA: hypothetical protein VGI64_16895 [Streptosporangiaceae bacterium]